MNQDFWKELKLTEPRITKEDHSVVCKWQHDHKTIEVFFHSDNTIFYLKTWGPHIFYEMEDGVLLNVDEFLVLWKWLNEKD